MPPIAEPKTIPTRCRVEARSTRRQPTASDAAASAEQDVAVELARASFGEATAVGSKSLTSAAIANRVTRSRRRRVIRSIPLSPASAARAGFGRKEFPGGVTARDR